ncbi:hypothetical protein SAMN06264849_11329 [Melghirimyces algeriensis]|uniref:Uncharacterized protein n=1 Tax=Melghirimyces algeriensis TaxID=910412 RepID=A0A521F7G9_9BACL|nr:hypothetical protein SAMN06264849_11329 [Melghirimyces algeriensis]
MNRTLFSSSGIQKTDEVGSSQANGEQPIQKENTQPDELQPAQEEISLTSSEQPIEEATKKCNEPILQEGVSQEVTVQDVQKKKVEIAQVSNIQTDNQIESMGTEVETENEQKVEKKKNNNPTTLSEKRLEKKRVRDIGLRIWKKEGEPPGRKRLIQEAKCTESPAKSVAAE